MAILAFSVIAKAAVVNRASTWRASPAPSFQGVPGLSPDIVAMTMAGSSSRASSLTVTTSTSTGNPTSCASYFTNGRKKEGRGEICVS